MIRNAALLLLLLSYNGNARVIASRAPIISNVSIGQSIIAAKAPTLARPTAIISPSLTISGFPMLQPVKIAEIEVPALPAIEKKRSATFAVPKKGPKRTILVGLAVTAKTLSPGSHETPKNGADSGRPSRTLTALFDGGKVKPIFPPAVAADLVTKKQKLTLSKPLSQHRLPELTAISETSRGKVPSRANPSRVKFYEWVHKFMNSSVLLGSMYAGLAAGSQLAINMGSEIGGLLVMGLFFTAYYGRKLEIRSSTARAAISGGLLTLGFSSIVGILLDSYLSLEMSIGAGVLAGLALAVIFNWRSNESS